MVSPDRLRLSWSGAVWSDLPPTANQLIREKVRFFQNLAFNFTRQLGRAGNREASVQYISIPDFERQIYFPGSTRTALPPEPRGPWYHTVVYRRSHGAVEWGCSPAPVGQPRYPPVRQENVEGGVTPCPVNPTGGVVGMRFRQAKRGYCSLRTGPEKREPPPELSGVHSTPPPLFAFRK